MDRRGFFKGTLAALAGLLVSREAVAAKPSPDWAEEIIDEYFPDPRNTLLQNWAMPYNKIPKSKLGTGV